MFGTNSGDVVDIPDVTSLVGDSKEDCHRLADTVFFPARRLMSPSIDVCVLFGDSITQGSWDIDLNGVGQRFSRESFHTSTHTSGLISIIADVYARKLDVLNRGFSGYTTEWAIPIFKQVPILFYQIDGDLRIQRLYTGYRAEPMCAENPDPDHLVRCERRVHPPVAPARSPAQVRRKPQVHGVPRKVVLVEQQGCGRYPYQPAARARRR